MCGFLMTIIHRSRMLALQSEFDWVYTGVQIRNVWEVLKPCCVDFVVAKY